MSAMFRPPIATAARIGWPQVFGFAQDDEGFFSAVRAAQLAALYRYVPFNVAMMAINFVPLFYALRRIDDRGYVLAWGLAMAALAGLWLLRWRRNQRHGHPATATTRQFWLVSAEVAAFGVCWSGLIAHMLPNAGFEYQAVLLLLSLAVMGSCGFACAVAPLCASVLVTAIAISTLAAVPSGSMLASPLVALAYLTFTMLIVRGTIVTSFAMMARMRTQAELAERTAVAALLLNEFEANGSDWLIEVDAGGRLTHASERMARAAGQPVATLIGRPFLEIVGRRVGTEAVAVRALDERFRRREAFRDMVVPVGRGDKTQWWSISATPKLDGGICSGYRGVVKDITEVRRGHERIVQLAQFDVLTGLANRVLFREKLEDGLARAVRTGVPCALLFIDLDRFKLVNDTLGHQSGDKLLREAASRLRQAAGGGAKIGRLGGDEFAVLLADASPRRAAAVSRAIVATLARPFELDGVAMSIGASVGFAVAPQDGDTGEAIMRSADMALHEIKANGRGGTCRFVPELGSRVRERRELERELAHALERDELALVFQPVVAAADERVVAFEALLRWTHPRLGTVSPARFIPIAEESGAIVAIGHWVLRAACRWAARWPAHVRIAVNLSPAQFDDPLLIETVRAALAEAGLDAARLELEITESLFLNEKAATIERLAALKALGVSFALDDFGTGYSSLGYLQKASFSRIKIDRSFVSRLTRADPEATAIIQAIVSLARSLAMETTAEGVESRAEFEACRSLGCAHIQGYLFGRPMPPEEASALVTGVRLLEAA